MKRIGLISDTHNLFDDKLRSFLDSTDEIWHAGDIGSLELADRIAAFKPLRAVYGNIDDARVRSAYNRTAVFDVEGFRVLMTHIGGYPSHYDRTALEHIYQTRPQIFIAGHSHILKVIYDKRLSLLHLNPGAAGTYGFHKVRTALRFTLDGGDIRDMEIGEWPK